MTDLGQRLRDAVDPVPPIPLDEAIQAARARGSRRSGGRRQTALVVAAAALIAAALIIALVRRPAPASVQVTSPPSTAVSTSASRHGITVTMALRQSRVTTGDHVRGWLIFDNRTGRRWHNGDDCRGDDPNFFLEGHHVPYALPSGGGCTHPYIYRRGTTVLPFSVPTNVGDGPFPPGRYRLVVTFYPPGVPVPRPVPVTLTPRRS